MVYLITACVLYTMYTVLLLQREGKFIGREWRGRQQSSETLEGTLTRRTTTTELGGG